jgi:hypothetical protein
VSDPYLQLQPEDVRRITATLSELCEHAPDPYRPLLVLLDGSEATANDIADALGRKGSRLRAHLLNLVAVAMGQGEPLEEILDDFRWEWRG